MRINRIGVLAQAALARSGAIARPLRGYPGAPYFEAAGEIVWVGARLPALHPRAIVTAGEPPLGEALRFDRLPEQAWSPPRMSRSRVPPRSQVVATATLLRAAMAGIHVRPGPGTSLMGANTVHPIEVTAQRVSALARAYAQDSANAVAEASLQLLGVGSGLTPSGDDLAGAALFGRRWLLPFDAAWEAAAAALSSAAGERSHPISAALVGDLAGGWSFAPLHALVEAIAAGDAAAAQTAASDLCSIGHSSGRDMLAGVLIGITGTPG